MSLAIFFSFYRINFRGSCDSCESQLPLFWTIYFPTAPFCPAGICYVYLAAWTCRRSADRISRYLRFLWYASLTPSTAANSTAAEGQMIHVRCHSIVWKLQPR